MSLSPTQPLHPMDRRPPEADAGEAPPPEGPLRAGWWFTALSGVLLGYALLGRGFAYVGLPPLFVGELVLLAGGLSLLYFCHWRNLLDPLPVWMILLLLVWGSLQTYPYVRTYGMDALRDAVIWGYSLGAILVFAHLLTRPERLTILLEHYQRFALVFVALMPAIWAGHQFFGEALPRWPWADVPVVVVKGGDVLVHLGGILAFWVALAGGSFGQVGWLPLAMLSGTVMMVGSDSRAGLISFLVAMGICFVAYPGDRSLWRILALGLAGVLLLGVSGIEIHLPEKNRTISFAQLVENASSVTGGSEVGDLEGTKQWRLNWWNDIIDYTVHGPYFWTGKGFGVNLADDDGYQGTDWDGQLRSPHNGHLTMLARAGVPGFTLWVLVQAAWAGGIVCAGLRARLRGEARWAGLFVFLFAYWAAMTTRAGFDVYLEGPMGGIWFWTIFGVGLAALWIYRHQPQLLESPSENPLRA